MTDDTAARDVIARAAEYWLVHEEDSPKCADAILAALRAAGFHLHRWQDISEAPKMRTLLLFAVTAVDETGKVLNWKMETGCLMKGYQDEPDVWEWGGRRLKAYDHQPTHFAPLPPAPPEPAP